MTGLLLKFQFPDMNGLEPCWRASNLSFKRHSGLFIQIINRSPNGSGSHWLTVSNIKSIDLTKEVTIYDSAFTDLPQDEGLVIASLVDVDGDMLHVHFTNVQLQRNSYDCGLFSIANATTLAFGRNPVNETYDTTKMRSHLITCLENKEMSLFPTKKFSGKRKPTKKVIKLELFCLCMMPDTGTLYVICDECSKEYHPGCVNIEGPVTDSMEFLCPLCRSK